MVQFEKKIVPLPRVPLSTGSSQWWSRYMFTSISSVAPHNPGDTVLSVPHSRGHRVQGEGIMDVEDIIPLMVEILVRRSREKEGNEYR